METNVNFIAIVVAALSAFMVGGVWYSPLLFAKPWMKANGLTDEQLKKGSYFKIFGGALVLSVVMALNLGYFLGNDLGGSMGAFIGFLTGFGWVAMSIGVIYLFERKSLILWGINAGYQIVTFTLMGFIIGVWQ